MAKSGYRESTIRAAASALKATAKRVNILSPEETEAYLAKAEISMGKKELITRYLSWFYKYKDIPFEKPHYKRVENLPFIPLESEINQLISGVDGW